LLALACTFVGLAVLVLLIPTAPLTGDGRSYVEFVRNGLQGGASSWHERRLLGPLIVRALPLDPLQGFFALTLVSIGAAALLTWRAAVVLVGDNLRALLAVPLLLGTWVVAPNIREYALIDPLAWAFVAGVWLCTLQRRWVPAAAIAAAGVLAKEVVLLAAVAAAAAAWSPRAPVRPVLVFAPAALVVVALTLLFPGSGTDAFAYVTKWVQDGLGSLGPARVVFLIFASYAALWLLVPSGWLALPPHVRRGAAVFLIAAPVLPFIGSPERMLEAIFPVVISAAVLATASWPLWMVSVLALGNLLFVARVGGDARVPTVIAWGGLALALAMVAWAWLRPGRGALLGRLAPTRGAPRDTTAPST
jgi:hypothetical protein